MYTSFHVKLEGSIELREYDDYSVIEMSEPKSRGGGSIHLFFDDKELTKKVYTLIHEYQQGVVHGINCDCTDTVDGICKKYTVPVK